MAVQVPFSKVCCARIGSKRSPVLFAASGESVQALNLVEGSSLCQWPYDEDVDDTSEDEGNGVEDPDDGTAPPAKRQRIDDGEATAVSRQPSEQSEPSITISTEGCKRQKGERWKPKIPSTTLPNVSHLIATSDGKHLVVVTAEDKAVKVLEISPRGRLREVSSRTLPKRLCAITLNADEDTILTADKFGDVYAIPLHPSDDYEHKADVPIEDDDFKPSATELTVHTKGNLEALKQQQKQKIQPKTKEGLSFEHKLLLGHVSLLTDLIVAKGPVDGIDRPFILSCDRDEHIRISRGMPQAHIIENFCLGNQDFVSRLCVLPWQPEILVVGNGEPSLRIYDWQNGEQKGHLSLVDHFEVINEVLAHEGRSKDQLAVSLVKAMKLEENIKLIAVALEGLPVLFTFVNDGFKLRSCGCLVFAGNVLDVAQVTGLSQIVVSTDGVHTKGSMKTFRNEDDPQQSTIQVLEAIAVAGAEDTDLEVAWQGVGARLDLLHATKEFGKLEKEVTNGEPPAKAIDKHYSALGEFLYGLENLRKRRNMPGEDEDEEVGRVLTEEAETQEASITTDNMEDIQGGEKGSQRDAPEVTEPVGES